MNLDQRATLAKALFITAPYWQARLDLLSHPSAIRMATDLDPHEPLGIGPAEQPFWKGFKHTYGSKDSNIDFLLRIKNQHPEKIVLVQIGEFYETWGIDSVFLVEHCGLNRMGRRGVRAGTPLINIQKVLDDLTAVGFSVVVCEQAADPIKNARKTRFISEIVTPASPVYTHGLAMDKTRSNTLFPDSPPEFGIVFDKRGVTVVEINPDLRTVLTLEGLTKEAALARLARYGGRLSHVFCHTNVDDAFIDACRLRQEHLSRISDYLPREFPQRVVELIKIDLNLAADAPFTQVHPVNTQDAIIPRPLYLSTAQQMGILSARGVPKLLEHMLPKGSPVSCQNLLKHFLLNPPPKSIADEVRTTLQTLANTDRTVPEFPVANPARYVKTLQKHEASPEILKDLFKIAESFLACQRSAADWALPQALNVVAHILSFGVHIESLVNAAQLIIDTLTTVLPVDEDDAYLPTHPLISKHLFEYIDTEFRGHVAKTATPEIFKRYRAAERAAFRYARALEEDLIPLIEQRAAQRVNNKKLKPLALSFDIHNKTIWMRGPVNQQDEPFSNVYHPIDRYGKAVKDRWTTVKVEKYLRDYKVAAEQARISVAALLSDICQTLALQSLPIVHLATFSNLMRTLILHTKECQPKGWNLAVDYAAQHRLRLNDFFPYWLQPDTAVNNSITLNGMALLTGHNMAGKSTTIRSAAVVSLLAATGFMFPARQVGLGEVIDGWYLRTGMYDDPAAGLSTFAVEMNDIKIALRDASNNSLVLIDELGKGTETASGHAIAASVLEHLQAHRVKGIFATHWHELFFNPAVQLNDIQMIRMAIERGKPSYKIALGSCLSSAAFQTAAALGVDLNIIERAKIIERAYANDTPRKQDKVDEPAAHYVSHSLSAASNALSNITQQPLSAIKHVAANAQAAVMDQQFSVLYVLRTALGFYYVGETDNIGARIVAHRQTELKKDCEFIYTPVPQGKSTARKFETALIKRLQALGFPMLSVTDARHSHFGSA